MTYLDYTVIVVVPIFLYFLYRAYQAETAKEKAAAEKEKELIEEDHFTGYGNVSAMDDQFMENLDIFEELLQEEFGLMSWVLFEHGTYVLVDNTKDAADLQIKATEQVKKYSQSEDLTKGIDVIDIVEGKKWMVHNRKHNMYVLVTIEEIEHIHQEVDMVKESYDEYDVKRIGSFKYFEDGKSEKFVIVNKGMT